MEEKSNLRAKRKELGLTLNDVAIAAGTSRQTIQKYESGIITTIPADKLLRIAELLHTTPAWLMGWPEAPAIPFGLDNIQPAPAMVRLPRLGNIACGEPILAVENIEEYDLAPSNISCDFTLVCRGDSMINARIYDGDVVYIRQQEAVENGEIAAVLIGEEATLKRVFLQSGQLVLTPENPKYAPMIFQGENLKDVRILGKAVAFCGKVY